MSSRLVDSSYYTGKFRSLNTYRSDVLLSCVSVARVRLQIADYDKIIEVAVDDKTTDDRLLGRDLGKKKWLLDDPPNPENTVREIRAQVSAEADQELSDHNDLIASGATPHLLSDVFPFEDEIFEDPPVHATPPSKHAESLPL